MEMLVWFALGVDQPSEPTWGRCAATWAMGIISVQREKGVRNGKCLFLSLLIISVCICALDRSLLAPDCLPTACGVALGRSGVSRAAPAAAQPHLEQMFCKYPISHLIL